MTHLHIVRRDEVSNLYVTKTNKSDQSIITITGNMTAENAESFVKQLPAEVDRSIILNFKNVTQMDGTGLLAFSIFFRHVRDQGHNLTLVDLQDQPERLLKHLNIYDLCCRNRRQTDTIAPKSVERVKRVLDVAIASTALATCILPSALICAAIRLESKGSPIYSQIRSRRHNRDSHSDISIPDDTFKMYKFRTMYQDAEKENGAVNASENDARITRVGKILRRTRLDELPNFINVLLGHMSVVGPRADRPEIYNSVLDHFPIIYERSRFVKPGITGPAQLQLKSNGDLLHPDDSLVKCLPSCDKYKSTLSFRFKLYYDAAYAIKAIHFKEWLKEEIKWILKTPIVMFFKNNTI
jgi:anti-anti-sigma factor